MLSLWKRRSLAVGYWHYWLNALHQPIPHSSFIGRFYREVVRGTAVHPDFPVIEQRRQQLRASRQPITTETRGAPSVANSGNTRTVGHVARHSLSTPKFGRFLYRLTQFQPSRTTLELGTSLGVTTLYLSADPNNRVITLEGCPETTRLARQTFDQQQRKNIDLRAGDIDHTLPQLLSEIDTVDLVYIDANHRKEPTMSYFRQLLPKVHSESVLVFDDIYWSFEMMEAWRAVRTHPQVTLSVDLFDAGVLFFCPLATQEHYTLKL